MRPLRKTEKANKNECAVTTLDEDTVRNPSSKKELQFDKMFTERHSQENVFKDTRMLIQSAVDGYSVCKFAYWQTRARQTRR